MAELMLVGSDTSAHMAAVRSSLKHRSFVSKVVGVEAISPRQAEQLDTDLVIVDAEDFAREKAWSLCRALRKAKRPPAVVLALASGGRGIGLRDLESGADELIRMPSDGPLFSHRLKQCLARRHLSALVGARSGFDDACLAPTALGEALAFDRPVRLLVVEAGFNIAEALSRTFGANARIEVARNGQDARASERRLAFDAAIVDAPAQALSRVAELCADLKMRSRFPFLPVIACIERDRDESNPVDLLHRSGFDDSCWHPMASLELAFRVRAQVRQARLAFRARTVTPDPLRRHPEELLTQVRFEHLFAKAYARSGRTRESLSVIRIGIGGLDPSQASAPSEAVCFHVARDFARRAQSFMRGNDQIAYLGRGEFVALLPHCDLTNAERIARRLHACAHDEQFSLPLYARTHDLSPYVGVASDGPRWGGRCALLMRAEKALERARSLGDEPVLANDAS